MFRKKFAQDKVESSLDAHSVQSLLEGIPDPLFVVDGDLTITYFNDAVADLTNYAREEVIGKKCRDVFRSNICDSGCAIRHCMSANETIRGAEVVIKKRNGEPVTIMANAAVLRDRAGNIIGGMETLRDITK